MQKKTILFLLLSGCATNCFAEGQYGLETFVAIIYAIAILFYTLVGFLLIKAALIIVKSKASYSNWAYIGISFFISLMLALITGDNFIPFFW